MSMNNSWKKFRSELSKFLNSYSDFINRLDHAVNAIAFNTSDSETIKLSGLMDKERGNISETAPVNSAWE